VKSLIILDLETLGLNAAVHAPVEAAWFDESFVIPHTRTDLCRASSQALKVNRYHERGLDNPACWDTDGTALRCMHQALTGNQLRGSNPGFDVDFLFPLFQRHGLPVVPWHYVPLDIGTYAAGVLGLPIQDHPGLTRLCALLGIAPGDHAAMGDVMATYAALVALRAIVKGRRPCPAS
jgi:DNA polymerase III subunit epsilon